MSKTPYFYIDGKPRLLFILLGVRNDSVLNTSNQYLQNTSKTFTTTKCGNTNSLTQQTTMTRGLQMS